MRIVVTGASGLIGRRLVHALHAGGHRLHLLGRTPRTGLPPGTDFSIWDALGGEPPEAGLAGADAVVHLAGEAVAQRWTKEAKRLIRASRIEGTRRLVQVLGRLPAPPKTLVCASAIGYYGDRADEVLAESSAPGSGFLPEVCIEWEKAAQEAASLGVRVACLRTGIVLAAEGGALGRMLPAFKAGLGGRLGSGKQWMSWIHVEDLLALYRFALETPSIHGAVNATAPNPLTNADFALALGKALGRPAIFPVPAAFLKVLFGEMAEVMLASQRVLPEAAQAAGFVFQHPSLLPALKNLLG